MVASDDMAISTVRRALELLRILAGGPPEGMRLKDIGEVVGYGQSMVHRLLQDLILEGVVEQVSGSKRYRPALEFFVLAARIGESSGLRRLAGPTLLRLSATLSESIFLLVRTGFDAVCLDLVEGPYPIRSFTGDIGGKVPLGLGQGSLAILSHLPEAEQEAVIRFNMPRLIDKGFLDEATLRVAIAKAREQGWADLNSGLIPGMAGVGVPVFDAHGLAVASLSVGTLAERLTESRLAGVVKVMKAEAEELSQRLNPFDMTLRHPMRSLAFAKPVSSGRS
ncbi:IclR family transcriptional regulator [Labrys portucalensis]|uniref:IclR family transcriptional regulator n=1 Tax=Labrys neptuniae TaxID=376174 RepID=A0ABV3PTV7_9HYPH|nr:IclR family transcriptional regulator [Labrys neptuniae]MDT3376961.1 IclR family transcriptional regulator [Labrys neptuniae]